MDTTIIELRQNSASTTNNANTIGRDIAVSKPPSADYQCSFDPPYLLRDGDNISIKSVFLDTRSKTTQAQTGKITIDDTNDKYNINHMIYITSYRGTDLPNNEGNYATEFGYNDVNTGSNTALTHPDGFKYVLGYNTASGSSNAGLKLSKLILKDAAPPRKRSKLHNSLKYTDINGKNQTYPVIIPSSKNHAHDLEVRFDDGTDAGGDLNMIYQSTVGATEFNANDIEFTDPQHIDQGGVDLEPNWYTLPYTNLDGTAEVVSQGANFQPYLIEVKFDIPHGTYEPSALAKYITDRITQQKFSQTQTTPINLSTTNPQFVPDDPVHDGTMSVTIGSFPTKNPYFMSIKQLTTDADYALTGSNIDLIREDGKSILKIEDNTTDFLVGANEMNLQYDDTLNKFVFTSQHSPILGGPAGTFTAGVQFSQVGNSGQFFSASQNSGIAFHSFPQTADGNKCSNLFFGALGFDNSIFSNTFPTAEQNYGFPAPSINNTKAFLSHLREGTNTTGALRSVDDFFQKSGSFAVATPMADLFITTDNLNSVVGNITQGPDGGELSNGYFLIEVNGLPNQQISYSMGGDDKDNLGRKSQSVKSVVGRFYATSDYTEDAGSGSIPYVYKGTPQYLTNLSVRVLDPDGTPTTSIGQDNTIFIQILSPIAQPQQ